MKSWQLFMRNNLKLILNNYYTKGTWFNNLYQKINWGVLVSEKVSRYNKVTLMEKARDFGHRTFTFATV